MTVLTITTDNFEEEVLKSNKPVLLDFWAPWCMPCKMFSPTFAEIAEEIEIVKFGKVNVDEQMDIAKKFNIRSIPTLLLLKDGQPVQTAVGMQSKEGIKEMLEK